MSVNVGLFLISAGFCAAICIVIEIVRERRRIRVYQETYEQISDEEFLRRCSAGVAPEVALKVRRMVADILPVEYERVHPESLFREISGC